MLAGANNIYIYVCTRHRKIHNSAADTFRTQMNIDMTARKTRNIDIYRYIYICIS